MSFKDSIRYNVDLQELLNSSFTNADSDKKELFYQEMEKYEKKFNSPQAQNYFHNLVVAIMLEHHKYFEAYDIECVYRFKSPKSIADKIVDYILRPEKHSNSDSGRLSIQSISDIFAMDLILTDRPSSFHSKDPEINRLISEKVKNQEFISKMQEFKSELVDDEFSISPTYMYNVTKKEYYSKCLEIVDRIMSLIPPEATDLLSQYQSKRDAVLESLSFLEDTMPDDVLVDETDFPSSSPNGIDFIKLLDNFSARIYDKVDLAILTKQANSIFEHSELIKKFGVSIKSFKEKRAPSGYTSNFVYLNTPLGVIECQLQAKNQYRDGNIGDSAHNKMHGKLIKGFKIPEPDRPDEVERFKSSVLYVAPRYYSSRIDDVEENKVITQGYTDYKSYRKVIGQVQRGSIQERTLLSYFERLYSLRDIIFDSNGSIQEFIPYDLNKYLKSDEFLQIINKSNEIELT